MGLFRTLSGQVRLHLTSADPAATLAALGEQGIILSDITADGELAVSFTASRRDHRRIRQVAARRGGLLKLQGRRGLYWDLKGLRKRPLFLAGLGLYLALALWVPSRVLIVEVRGNGALPANRILETAASCGIGFGASRQAVRSERVKNALLEAMPELAWAGVNTYGCRAVISVRCREPEPEAEPAPAVSSIVAARDGIILSCDVLRGSGLCIPGQAVAAGEVLISGYTDCGICITAGRAAGEIVAATARDLTAVTPAECLKKGAETGTVVKYSLIIGKNRINFDNNSGISDASCGRMVTEYNLTLPGGYRLPVTLVKQTLVSVEPVPARIPQERASAILSDFARRYLGEQMIAGTVTAAAERLKDTGAVWLLTGDYACTEMIGRERAEQNGESHETD